MGDTKLELLKCDLELLTVPPKKEAYLKFLLQLAEFQIRREGIKLISNIEDDGLIIMYAAHLYRSRNNPAAPMPRMIRLALNNRKLGKKDGDGGAT